MKFQKRKWKKQPTKFSINFSTQFQKVSTCVANSTDHCEIQRNIRLLSMCTKTLESFNANVENLISSFDEDVFNELVRDSPDHVCLRIKDWLCDLSAYQVGQTFKGFVSYVLDDKRKLCFLKDVTRFVTFSWRSF